MRLNISKIKHHIWKNVRSENLGKWRWVNNHCSKSLKFLNISSCGMTISTSDGSQYQSRKIINLRRKTVQRICDPAPIISRQSTLFYWKFLNGLTVLCIVLLQTLFRSLSINRFYGWFLGIMERLVQLFPDLWCRNRSEVQEVRLSSTIQ